MEGEMAMAMQKTKWLKLIDTAVNALEELEALRDQFEGDCADRSDSWHESDKGEKAAEITGETDLQTMIDDLSDLRAKVEEY
jgi:hypothetical protein